MHTHYRIGALVLMVVLITTVDAGTPKAPPQAPDANMATIIKEFPSYEKLGRRWRNIVISPDNSLEALTALAKHLHRQDPKTPFRIFTDGNTQQFRRFMLSDIHYATPKSAQYPYPETWANQHYIAMINQFGGAQRWQLQILNGRGVKPPVSWGTGADLN